MRQLFQWDPDIGYRYIPGLKARVTHESGGYLIRANNLGFRSEREFRPTKNPGTFRILLFGDSCTAGDGVPNGKRYSDKLERLIPNLEIYNFGLPGTGTDQQYLTWNKYASGIEHDAIMIMVMVENIRRIVARYRYYIDDHGLQVCYAKPYFELSKGELSLRHVPAGKEPVHESDIPDEDRAYIDRTGRFPRIRRVLIKTKLERLAHTLARFKPYPEYDSPRHPAWLLMRAILEKWIKGERQSVLLVPLPQYYFTEELSAPNYYDRFSELAAQVGCTFCDPLADLKCYSLEERRKFRFAQDVHPSPAGHAAIANALAPAVRKIVEGAHE